MGRIQEKLQDKAGHSLLLAMLFLLVCLFVGGNLLSGAAANTGRVVELTDRQDWLHQRSTLQLLAQMLEGSELTIREVKVKNGGSRVTYSADGENLLQELLYGIAEDRYAGRGGRDAGEITLSLPLPDGETAKILAYYSVNKAYDLCITFPEGDLHLTMKGYSAKSKAVTLTHQGVTTTTKTTVIYWEAPVIRKGGGI